MTTSEDFSTLITPLERTALKGLSRLDTLIKTVGEVFAEISSYSSEILAPGIGNDRNPEGENPDMALMNVIKTVDRFHQVEHELKDLVGEIDRLRDKDGDVVEIKVEHEPGLDDFKMTVQDPVAVVTTAAITDPQSSKAGPAITAALLKTEHENQNESENNNSSLSPLVDLYKTRDKLLKESRSQSEHLTKLLEQTYRLQFITQTLMGSFEEPLLMEEIGVKNDRETKTEGAMNQL
ncbi:hypothetical protein G9A89_003329 [Geosiphon pyriformis]|nr:hypothetical protein G9A89_003329 [Geosiphon pyriformis]